MLKLKLILTRGHFWSKEDFHRATKGVTETNVERADGGMTFGLNDNRSSSNLNREDNTLYNFKDHFTTLL